MIKSKLKMGSSSSNRRIEFLASKAPQRKRSSSLYEALLHHRVSKRADLALRTVLVARYGEKSVLREERIIKGLYPKNSSFEVMQKVEKSLKEN